MAEAIELSSLGSALGAIGKYLVDPVTQQYSYMFCFNNNIQDLQTELESLKATRDGVQLGEIQARNNMRIIAPNVEAWLVKANDNTEEAETIIKGMDEVSKGSFNGWCPNLKLRYSLSRKAVKKTLDLARLRDEGENYILFSLTFKKKYRPSKEFMVFESRISIMDEIIENLQSDEIDLIGLCGMGGIGKTTMVYEVAKRVEVENLFHEVAITVVKQEPNMTKIQEDIAEMLGLDLEQENLNVRANRLHQRLSASEENKRILVVLDDVWEEFDLKDLGIPLVNGSKGCKILYTSRHRDLWNDAPTKKDIAFPLLSKEEAWRLFREKAGDFVDTPDFHPIAKQIASECKGLPLALVTFGLAVKNKKREYWGHESALEQLREEISRVNFLGAPEKVYQSVELSYNYLEDEEAKKLCLLCCLFEGDSNIHIEDLVRYVFGLQLFGGINEVGEARDRVYVLVNHLKSCYLLSNGAQDDQVKMDPVVRNVIISIESGKKDFLISHNGKLLQPSKKATYEHCTSIYAICEENAELPDGLRCPNLKFLKLTCKNVSPKTPSNFFEGMGEVEVLELKSRHTLLLPSLQFLRNLRTLCINYCRFNSVSVIGELLNLEILSFRGSKIMELPKEIGKLSNLRLLDLSRCLYLERISPGVISGLVRLEELYMIGSNFNNWEGEGKEERRNASLREIQSLSNLVRLEIQIKNVALLRRVPLFSKLTKYMIVIGDGEWPPIRIRSQNRFVLLLDMDIPSECGINLLLKTTESLHLKGQGSKDVVHELVRDDGVEGLKHLKDLSIWNCDKLEFLANTIDWIPHTPITTVAAAVVFPILESLSLSHLPNLREICHGQLPEGSFQKLSFMELQQLPRFTGFCGEIDNIEFPQLKELRLKNLSLDSKENRNAAFLSIFPQKVAFPSLEKLWVSNCGSLRNLFSHSPSTSTNFWHLKELIIDNCLMMEEVIAKEEDEAIGDGRKDGTMFPKLKYLELRDLPVLTSFCHVTLDWELPLLKSISVFDCPEMKNLAPGFLRTPNLEVVWLKWWAPYGGVEGFFTIDLNYTMLCLYEKRGRAQSPGAATVGLTRLSHPISSPSASTSTVVRSKWPRFCCGC